jgi:hypothetical protein
MVADWHTRSMFLPAGREGTGFWLMRDRDRPAVTAELLQLADRQARC